MSDTSTVEPTASEQLASLGARLTEWLHEQLDVADVQIVQEDPIILGVGMAGGTPVSITLNVTP